MKDYEAFIAAKHRSSQTVPVPIAGVNGNDALFPFQRDLVRWALARGRAALFADTGLGKTLMQLEWARHVAQHGRCLILTPLAVAQQTQAEGKRFDIEATYRRRDEGDRITITNYELLDRFDPSAFVGIVLDESSILKAFDGKTRTQLIAAFSDTRWRLACTATPAPNDFTELGNHSEFLGIKARVEMLAEYFVHDGGSTQDWRLKGHARRAFWTWVCSWAALVKKPSDLGYADEGFALPPLEWRDIVMPADTSEAHAAGMLFAAPARTLQEQRAVRRASTARRITEAVRLSSGDQPCLIWCELNDEADAVTAAIEGAIQVKGSDDPDTKAERLLGFAEGRYRVLVTKPSIAGFGLNWQHCARMVFLGASHSYEQTYQAVRRCWRFGQRRPVEVFVVRCETEAMVMQNYLRKEADARRLAEEMMATARHYQQATSAATREWRAYNPKRRIRVPAWLRTEEAA